jgi:uncharacterized protein (DUF2062 family)
MRALLHKRIIAPLTTLLRTGITPRQLSFSIATGTIIGIFPVLGTTTTLCIILSLSLRLNMVAVQSFNWLMAAPQLLLLLPLMRLGEHAMGATPIPLTLAEVQSLYESGIWSAMRTMGTSLLHALLGWSIVAPPLFLSAYLVSKPLVTRLSARHHAHAQTGNL